VGVDSAGNRPERSSVERLGTCCLHFPRIETDFGASSKHHPDPWIYAHIFSSEKCNDLRDMSSPQRMFALTLCITLRFESQN
jgi:hypothetical protein